MPNCIYLYLYQIAQAKVEYLVGRNHLFIGVFVPHEMRRSLMAKLPMAQLGLRGDGCEVGSQKQTMH
jgi:hypothetical protein